MVYSAITKTGGNTGLTLRPKDQRVSQFDIDTKVELLGLQGELFSLPLEEDAITIPSDCKNGIWILRVISSQGVFQQKVEILK